jgi:hypothetical protein
LGLQVADVERAEAADRLVTAEAVLRLMKSGDAPAALAEASEADGNGIEGALALVLSGGSQVQRSIGLQSSVGDALERSREELAVTREAEEAATLSLDYDIDSLLQEFQQELRA